jgi:GSH-dependent disulfide-bond oxidoreductase
MANSQTAIDIYYWPTPNCWKITIFCEEAAVPYNILPINILERAQFTDHYETINPFRKVPAIVDPSGPEGERVVLAESAAILLYLSQKVGMFGGHTPKENRDILQWLLFQVGTIGPMLGQNHHFRIYARDKIPYAIDRYTNEARRIYECLDRRLMHFEFLCGSYSIADICVFPWTIFYKRQGIQKDQFPNFARWFEQLKSRPAVQRGINVGKDLRQGELTERQYANVFGVSAARVGTSERTAS